MCFKFSFLAALAAILFHYTQHSLNMLEIISNYKIQNLTVVYTALFKDGKVTEKDIYDDV